MPIYNKYSDHSGQFWQNFVHTPSAAVIWHPLKSWKGCNFMKQLCKAQHTADSNATQLSSWVASAVCTEFATSWRQFRRVWTNLPTASRVASCQGVNAPVSSHDPVELLRLVTSDDIIDQNSRSQTAMESVSKLVTESVGSRRELVANSVHTADATQLDSFWVASASGVCTGHNSLMRDAYIPAAQESSNLWWGCHLSWCVRVQGSRPAPQDCWLFCYHSNPTATQNNNPHISFTIPMWRNSNPNPTDLFIVLQFQNPTDLRLVYIRFESMQVSRWSDLVLSTWAK